MAQLVETQNLPVSWIRPSRWQYRQRFYEESMLELAKSLRDRGQIAPIMVFPTRLADVPEEAPEYELIAGERRVRATFALAMAAKNWPDLPEQKRLEAAIESVCSSGWWDYIADHPQLGLLDLVVRAEVWAGEPEEFVERVVLENIQREDPDPIDEAHGFKLLLDELGCSQRELARRLHISQTYISQRLSLLSLAEPVREAMITRAITPTQAREIAALAEPEQEAMCGYIITAPPDRATTRQVKQLAQQINSLGDDFFALSSEGVVAPDERNYVLLAQWALDQVDEEQRGSVLIKLADKGLLRRLRLDNFSLGQWVAICLGRSAINLSAAWTGAAQDLGRTCATCALRELTAPPSWDYLCDDDVDEIVKQKSCFFYVGPDEPVLIKIGHSVACPTRCGDDATTFCACGVEGFLQHLEEALQQEQEQRKQSQNLIQKLAWQLTHDYRYGQRALREIFPQVDFEALRWLNQPCELCAHCTGPEDGDCRYAHEPDKTFYQLWRLPNLHILTRQSDGVSVGQCGWFKWGDLGRLPESSPKGSTVAFLLDWLSNRYYASVSLGWLASPPDSSKAGSWLREQCANGLTDSQAWALIIMDINAKRINAIRPYSGPTDPLSVSLFNLTKGQEETWTTQNWTPSDELVMLLKQAREV